MILYFKQRFFSWFDSYDIYDENGETAYTVQGRLSWGHKLEIYDRSGNLCGTVKEKNIYLFAEVRTICKRSFSRLHTKEICLL